MVFTKCITPIRWDITTCTTPHHNAVFPHLFVLHSFTLFPLLLGSHHNFFSPSSYHLPSHHFSLLLPSTLSPFLPPPTTYPLTIFPSYHLPFHHFSLLPPTLSLFLPPPPTTYPLTISPSSYHLPSHHFSLLLPPTLSPFLPPPTTYPLTISPFLYHRCAFPYLSGGAALDLKACPSKSAKWIEDVIWLNLVELSKQHQFAQILDQASPNLVIIYFSVSLIFLFHTCSLLFLFHNAPFSLCFTHVPLSFCFKHASFSFCFTHAPFPAILGEEK